MSKRVQEAIDRNLARRKQLKIKWDKFCKYSADEVDQLPSQLEVYSTEVPVTLSEKSTDNWVRMLDEGLVVEGNEKPFAVIRKGALKSFYENLPDDFEGYIDKDHVRSIRLGEYTKKDMKLVELGEGRYAIDINVKLDTGYYATRDLLRQNEHRAVSVEMHSKVDEFGIASSITDDPAAGDYLVPIIGAVNIVGYAVCENPKNVNSIKNDLLEKASVEGETMNKEELEKLQAEENADVENKEATADENASTDENTEADNDEDVKAPETGTEDASEGGEESGEEGEETGEENTENSEPEAKLEAEEDNQEGLEQLAAAIKELRAELDEKNAKIAELEHQLSAKAEVKMSEADTIAQLLKFAKGGEPTAEEGSKVNMSSTDAKSNKYAEDDDMWDEAAKSLQ